MGGVQKTTDFLDKSTWTLATILIVLILLSSLSFTGTLSDNDSKIIDDTEASAPKAVTPKGPATQTPVAQPTATTETPAAAEPAATEPEKK